jgi:hypothetical protein
MNTSQITKIQDLALGSDSQLELVLIKDYKYIIKTYLGPDSIVKKNREQQFHQELNRLGLVSFSFYYPELIRPDQICIEFIDNLQPLAELNDFKYFSALADFMTNLHTLSQSKQDYDQYYDWLLSEIINSKARQEYVSLAIELIEKMRLRGENLTLLHSDFHDNNIGVIGKKNILIFDSGHCPYIFGHKYHDLSRLVLYYPDQIIFEELIISPKMVHLYQSIGDKKLFIQFCYIQSLLVYNNQWVTQTKAITEHLFKKLTTK